MSWFVDIFNDVGRALDKVTPNEVKPIIKAVAAPIAVAVTGVVSVPAIIAVSALANVATGQKPEDAIKNAAIGAVTGEVGSKVVGGVASNVTKNVLGDTAKNVIVGGTTVGDVVTGAITKGVTGGATAALTGGDVGKGVISGAVSGAVSPLVTGAIDAATGTGKPTYTDPETGKTSIAQGPPSPPTIAGSNLLGGGFVGGITPLVSNTLGGIAVGQRPEDAFKRAIPGAVGGALSGAALYGLGVEPSTANLLGQTGATAAQYLSGQGPSYPTYQARTREATSPTMTGGRSLTSAGGPSTTLGQSLSIAPTLGYSPGGTVFGVGGEGDTPKRRVWNVASLRNIGEEV